MIGGSPIVLNALDGVAGDSAKADFLGFRTALADLQANFYTPEGVRYDALRASPEFADFERSTAVLRSFDLSTLRTHEEKLAFWINLYNVLTVHAILKLGIKKNHFEVWNFFGRVSYEVGGHRFSLMDIEHGILRANRSHWTLLYRPPFSAKDPRRPTALDRVDPRIHFALVCGAKSCPPIGAYFPDRIDAQLDIAARNFIAQDAEIDLQQKTFACSSIVKWYKVDFGATDAEVIRFLAGYLEPSEAKREIEARPEAFKLVHHPYDWTLNHAN